MLKLLISSVFLATFVVAKDKILVLHDDKNVEMTYSKFFDNLKRLAFDIEFQSADSANLQLVQYGENLYQHVMLMAPNTDEFGGDLSPFKLSEYVDNGGNLIIALDSTITDTMRASVAEFGIEADTEGTLVIDHFNYSPDHDDGTHTVLNLNTQKFYSDAKPFHPKNGKPDSLLFHGIGMILNKNNNLVNSALTAPSTAYSWSPDEKVSSIPMMVGREISLISTLEARNNARVLVCGSMKFFSDEFAQSNEQVARQIALWAFQRAGVLKLSNPHHFLTDSHNTLECYTIYDQVTFAVDIFEKSLETGEWIAATNSDVQVEFTRLDPFVRQFLTRKGNSATQILDFKVPDVYGVYKFIVEYKRVGYTYLQSQVTVPVRPLQHTQYERFLVTAYPYYAGAGSMMVGLFLFSFVFLYHK